MVVGSGMMVDPLAHSQHIKILKQIYLYGGDVGEPFHVGLRTQRMNLEIICSHAVNILNLCQQVWW